MKFTLKPKITECMIVKFFNQFCYIIYDFLIIWLTKITMDRELIDQVSGKKCVVFTELLKKHQTNKKKSSKNQKCQYYFRYLTYIIDWVL